MALQRSDIPAEEEEDEEEDEEGEVPFDGEAEDEEERESEEPRRVSVVFSYVAEVLGLSASNCCERSNTRSMMERNEGRRESAEVGEEKLGFVEEEEPSNEDLSVMRSTCVSNCAIFKERTSRRRSLVMVGPEERKDKKRRESNW